MKRFRRYIPNAYVTMYHPYKQKKMPMSLQYNILVVQLYQSGVINTKQHNVVNDLFSFTDHTVAKLLYFQPTSVYPMDNLPSTPDINNVFNKYIKLRNHEYKTG